MLSEMGKILLFQPGSLGDSFFTSALSDVIKKEKKDIKIFFYTTETSKEMVIDNPHIDDFIIHTGNLIKDIKNLRKFTFDLIIDTWAIGDAYYRIAFSKSKRKVAIRKKRSEKYLVPFVYTDQIEFKRHGYVFWDRMELLNFLDIDANKYIKKELPVYHISEEVIKKVKGYIKTKEITEDDFYVIAPKGLWKTKDIPVNLVANITDILMLEFNKPVVLASHPSDRWYLNKIVSLTKSKPYIFTSDSIREFGALIKLSKHLISVESLPYHLAVGLRKPATVILGGYPIWKPENYSLLNFANVEMECKFCCSANCKLGNYRCLLQIKPEDVIHKVMDLK